MKLLKNDNNFSKIIFIKNSNIDSKFKKIKNIKNVDINNKKFYNKKILYISLFFNFSLMKKSKILFLKKMNMKKILTIWNMKMIK